MKYLLFAVILINLYSREYHFYPDGAPLNRCGDMMPQHGVGPKDGPAPFEISVSRAYHEEKMSNKLNKQYYVNIHVKDEESRFKGFLIEARGRWDGESLGVWNNQDVKHTKLIDCFNRPQVTRNFEFFLLGLLY